MSRRAATRWRERLHPWIYRSDVLDLPHAEPGALLVLDERGDSLGMGLWSPASTIALRMLTHDEQPIDAAFWHGRVESAIAFRASLSIDASAYRLVHAEADGLPALVVDRYGEHLVAQFLSAGVEQYRAEIVEALRTALEPAGILARDDVPIRRHERLTAGVPVLLGSVPDEVGISEAGVRAAVPLRTGQKTGAFLDQRENRVRAGALSRGTALDCFAYHGAFALHLARGADRVVAVESSAGALAHARANARLNQLDNCEFVEANVFDYLREKDAAGARYDLIVLDPPAFAKRKDSVDRALSGYKEINLRAMRLLAPGGYLCTFSCSYRIGRERFRAMLDAAAADARRPLRWVEWRGQAADHPEIVQIPESAYLKGAVLQAV